MFLLSICFEVCTNIFLAEKYMAAKRCNVIFLLCLRRLHQIVPPNVSRTKILIAQLGKSWSCFTFPGKR